MPLDSNINRWQNNINKYVNNKRQTILPSIYTKSIKVNSKQKTIYEYLNENIIYIYNLKY